MASGAPSSLFRPRRRQAEVEAERFPPLCVAWCNHHMVCVNAGNGLAEAARACASDEPVFGVHLVRKSVPR
eukprot:6999569-Alexandrium_andersonii.AAC.1